MSFDDKSPGSEGAGHNCLSCGAIWRQNCRLDDTCHILTGKRLRGGISGNDANNAEGTVTQRDILQDLWRFGRHFNGYEVIIYIV
ncbi:hypothetical protein M5K25_020827 [Dendrobium thyrsiflorum]|uniref:Uncharacterized protein n=1 Tax=Dendrobium thyrsiflorum TaxID=117978 RepID=A0ABD0UAV8_DENTH